MRALTIALDFSGGGEGGGGAFGASGNFSGARYQGGTVWHTDKRPDEAVTKVYFRLSELPAVSYHGLAPEDTVGPLLQRLGMQMAMIVMSFGS